MMPRSPIPVPRKLIPRDHHSSSAAPRIYPRGCGVKPNTWLTSDRRTSSGDLSDLTSSGSPDLNLHTLIDSVERDIELLEQLENHSVPSLDNDLILPTSAALLSLPGYKPRTSTRQGWIKIFHTLNKYSADHLILISVSIMIET